MTEDKKRISEIELTFEWGLDIKGRRVFLQEDIDSDSIPIVTRGLYMLADRNSEPITLFVSSYGGSLEEAFMLHDVTRTLTCPIHTVAMGKCMSAAPLLVACGEQGNRWAGESTSFMVHDASMGVYDDNPDNVAVHAKLGRDYMNLYATLLARYTKQPKKFWQKLFSSKVDKFFSADEAVKWGIIDALWSEK